MFFPEQTSISFPLISGDVSKLPKMAAGWNIDGSTRDEEGLQQVLDRPVERSGRPRDHVLTGRIRSPMF